MRDLCTDSVSLTLNGQPHVFSFCGKAPGSRRLRSGHLATALLSETNLRPPPSRILLTSTTTEWTPPTTLKDTFERLTLFCCPIHDVPGCLSWRDPLRNIFRRCLANASFGRYCSRAPFGLPAASPAAKRSPLSLPDMRRRRRPRRPGFSANWPTFSPARPRTSAPGPASFASCSPRCRRWASPSAARFGGVRFGRRF